MSQAEPAGGIAVKDLLSEDGEFRFTVTGPGGQQRVNFWGDVPAHPAPAEPALAVALLPAMAAAAPLSLPGPLSPQLRRTLPDVQAVLASLALASPLVDQPLHTVDVIAGQTAPDVTPEAVSERPGAVGVFFSGGIDSWAALLANPDVTDLIYVHGFDVPVDEAETSASVERRLASTAARLGKRLLVVRTNLRALLDPSITWEIAHGPALTAVALLLSPRFERVLIGAGMTYGQLFNRGSHPLHDHLWSTERCRIEHHGAHLTRAAKTSQVAASQEALDVLRVCWRQVDQYNCGQCEKCLRTMVAVEVVGALKRCPTFETSLDLEAVAALEVADPELRILWQENLDLAREHEAPLEVRVAIEACLAATEVNATDEESLANELQAVVSSHSWRLTAPLRWAGAAARRLKRRAAGA